MLYLELLVITLYAVIGVLMYLIFKKETGPEVVKWCCYACALLVLISVLLFARTAEEIRELTCIVKEIPL